MFGIGRNVAISAGWGGGWAGRQAHGERNIGRQTD